MLVPVFAPIFAEKSANRFIRTSLLAPDSRLFVNTWAYRYADDFTCILLESKGIPIQNPMNGENWGFSGEMGQWAELSD